MFGLPLPLDIAVRGILLAVAGLSWIILLVRVIGLRTFSKMTAFDFVVTLATASLFASAAAATSWAVVAQALIAIAALLGLQVGLARSRQKWSAFRKAIENEPLMLIRHGSFIDAALAESRVTRQDVLAKIRQANILQVADVQAVVLETTGDISILAGGTIDPILLADIRTP